MNHVQFYSNDFIQVSIYKDKKGSPKWEVFRIILISIQSVVMFCVVMLTDLLYFGT